MIAMSVAETSSSGMWVLQSENTSWRLITSVHYENMSVQYEAISKCGKNDILDVKI